MKPEHIDPTLSAMIAGYGDRLRAARLAAGFKKQAEFAKILNVSVYRYNHWEQERHPPGPHYLAILKQQFGIGADWILSGDYGSLSARVLQALVNVGASLVAPESAKELRNSLPEPVIPSPGKGQTLHEGQSRAPGRLIRNPDS